MDKQDLGRKCRTARPLFLGLRTPSCTGNMALLFIDSNSNLPLCKMSICIHLYRPFHQLNTHSGRSCIPGLPARRVYDVLVLCKLLTRLNIGPFLLSIRRDSWEDSLIDATDLWEVHLEHWKYNNVETNMS